MELCDHPAYELSLLLRQKRIRAVEIVESCLQRIEAVDGRPGKLDAGEITDEDRERVHAFITVTAQRALAQARAVDEKLAAGEDPGPLAGIPFSVKDIFCVRGTPSTAASRMLAKAVYGNHPYAWPTEGTAEGINAITQAQLKDYQVNAELMKHAKPNAIFMNCLPALRGYEQTADVIDGPQSVVFDEAENRLHIQKAVMLTLIRENAGKK